MIRRSESGICLFILTAAMSWWKAVSSHREVDARIGFRRGPAVTARSGDAGDDREYRCPTGPLLVGPHQGQADRPGPGPRLHVRHAVSADLFDAISLADR